MRKIFGAGIGVVLVVVLASPAAASDASAIKKLVITKADVPSGFQSSTSSPSDPTIFGKIAACVGKSVKNRKVTATLDGPSLVNASDSTRIESSVDVVKTKAMAAADRAVVKSSKFPDCVAQINKEELASQGVTDATGRTANHQSYGDFTAAVLLQLTVDNNGQTGTVSVVQVLIQKGRAELAVTFAADGTTPFDRGKAETILSKLNARLKKARI